MKSRRAPVALIVVCLLLFCAKAGCSRKDGQGGAPLTPTKGRGYTPLAQPPTATFVPGLPTPPPDLPG